MDEPLSNLDAKLRVQMRADIAELQARLGTTTVYVTHDQAEAMTLGHRVAVLKDGRLQQCDTARVLYDRPANTFVAGFIGSPAMNLCTVPCATNGRVSLGGSEVSVSAAAGGCRRRLGQPGGRRRHPARGARPRSRRNPGEGRGRRGARSRRFRLLRRRPSRRRHQARRARRRGGAAGARGACVAAAAADRGAALPPRHRRAARLKCPPRPLQKSSRQRTLGSCPRRR